MCALFREPEADEAPELWQEEATWLQRHRGIVWRTVALTLWGGTLLWFYFADKLILYIKPIYHPFALGAGMLLVGLALFEFVNLLVGHRAAGCCGEGQATEYGHVAGRLAAVILLVPLIVNALVPSTGLTSYAAGKRATELDFAALADQMAADWQADLARAEELAQEYPELTIVQLQTWAVKDPAGAEGRKVSAIGFVSHPGNVPPDSFMLVRFKMWCCAADAYPVSLPIRWEQAAEVEKDRWVRVRGTLAFAQQGERRVLGLAADSVEYLKKKPRNQYM